MSGLFSLHKQQILSEIMHAAVQSGTNARSQSPKNQPSSSRQTSLVAKNKKSAYGTLHTTEHQIQVNIKVIYPKYSKHWLYTVAHTIDCVCSKMLNHGLNHGLFILLHTQSIVCATV